MLSLLRRLRRHLPRKRERNSRSLLAFLLLLFPFLLTEGAAASQPAFAVTEGRVCDGKAEGVEREDFDDSKCEPRQFDDIDPQGKLVWFRTTVSMEGDLTSGPLAVFTGALASREIWWNGEKIGDVGRPGASRAEEEAGAIDAATFIPPRLLRQGDNVLALRVSSFEAPLRVRAPMHFLYVGPYELNSAIFRVYIPALLTAGALIAAAAYFGVFFLRDRRDPGALFIALMSTFAVLQLGAESLRGLVGYPYPFQIWRLIAVGLFAFGFALSMTAYVTRRFAPDKWRRYVSAAAIGAVLLAPFAPGFDSKALAALLIPTLASLVAAFHASRRKQPEALPAVIALSVFAFLIVALNAVFLNSGFFFAAGALVVVLLVDQAQSLNRARLAAEAARSRAAALELELVKRRIAPHFLMNALNALTDWVERDPKTGVRMIDALAGEFRLLSQISDRPLIPLAEEIALCRRHLEVMSYRTDRAFSLRLEGVDERLAVPPGVIHTLVENAFTHGRFAAGAEFILSMREEAGSVQLELIAPPAEASGARRKEGGEGLSYVRRRLEAAFGEAASVESGPATEGGWRNLLMWRPKQ